VPCWCHVSLLCAGACLVQVVSDLRQAEGGGKTVAERRRQQSQVLSAVFETYFRILKTTHEAATAPPAPKTRCITPPFSIDSSCQCSCLCFSFSLFFFCVCKATD